MAHWVVCYDYAAGPYSQEEAQRLADVLNNHPGYLDCQLRDHEVIESGTLPETDAERARKDQDEL